MQWKHHILIPVRKLLYHYNSFCLKDLSVSMLSPSCKSCYYCPEDKVCENFLIVHLVWSFLFFSKIALCGFVVIWSNMNLGHDTTIVLLTTNSVFYQIYNHFTITIKIFLYLKNFIEMFTFESVCIFIWLNN